MKSGYNTPSLAKLIDCFERIPGVGHKSAQRMAFYVLNMNEADAKSFAEAIVNAHENIKRCHVCCNISEGERCSICSNEGRDKSTVCVVEDPRDILAFERTGEYHGVYHVLHGVISPMNGVGPEDICVKELIARLDGDEVKEIIMATNPTVEGEATAMYISRLVKPFGVKVTRLAYGMPVGADLEYADEVTLTRALEGRQAL